MEIYITGMALGSITVLSITNSVIMPWMDGDWRKILWIYSSIVFLSGLIWLLISTHPESREMEVNLSKYGTSISRSGFSGTFQSLAVTYYTANGHLHISL